MKIFYYIIVIFSISYACAESRIPKYVFNGLKKITDESDAIIPYSSEIFGGKYRYNQNLTILQNIVNEQNNGSFIVFSEKEVICIGHKENNLFNGEYCIYPDGEFSVRVIIKKGVLDGKCEMIFQPFMYCADTKGISFCEHPIIKKLGISENEWIKDGDRNLKIHTEGFFKNGKKFSGDFLNILGDGDARIVNIETYENFKLTSTTEQKVYIIRPYVLSDP